MNHLPILSLALLLPGFAAAQQSSLQDVQQLPDYVLVGELREERHQDRRSVKASIRSQVSAQASFHSANARSKKECGAPS